MRRYDSLNLSVQSDISDIVASSSALLCHSASAKTLVSLAGCVTGGWQLLAVCARRLGQGPSVDDRLREDGAAAGAADPGPPDPLGGGQQGGRLPAGTGQPH